MAHAIADVRVRYLLGGGVATLLYFSLFAAGELWLLRDVPYMVTFAVAHVCTMLVAFPLYRTFVFAVHGGWVADLARFSTVYATGIAISVVALPGLVEVFSIPVLIAQAAILVTMPLLGFLAHRHWSFRRAHVGSST